MNKKKLIPLVVVAGVAVALGIALLVLLNQPQAAEETGIPLTDLPAESVTSIHYTNSDGLDITLNRPATGEDATWTLESDPALPIDQGTAGTLATDLTTLQAARALDETPEAAEMGFDAPTMEFLLAGDTGSFALTVGALNSMTNAYYAKVEGSDTVYTVAAEDLSGMCKDEATLYAAQPVTDLVAGDVVRMTLNTGDEVLHFTKTEDTWALDDDPTYALDQDVVSRMVTTVCGLKTTWSITSPGPDGTYGLDTTNAVITLATAEGKSVECRFGGPNPADDTSCYLSTSYAPGVVSTVASNNLSAFAYTRATLAAATPETAESTDEVTAEKPVE
ncbi:MAG: DUF4340 domain-containing protein [Gemmiger sp.]|nr:DUF4340 domain-containing protein [Gemmiger sp.]